MRRFSTEAILLRSVDYGESDRIVRLLIPESGRLTAMAKGARRSVKRFAGSLDVFNHLHVTLGRKRPDSMAFLERARLNEPFLGLRARSTRYAVASHLLELLDRMAPEAGAAVDGRRLFGFALSALRSLADAEPDRRMCLLLELRALDALGLRPELGRCVRCGRTPTAESGRAAFHVADGGAICSRCRLAGDSRVLPVDLATLGVLRRGLECEPEQLGTIVFDPAALCEAEELVFRFQRFHVGLELRSERFLDQTLGRRQSALPSLTPARA